MASLHRSRVSTLAIVLLVVAALIAVAAGLAVSGVGHTYVDWAVRTWQDLVAWIKGLFTS
ncbi:hypothetical protein GCM10029964_094270 [Kibdelosporangium lantanae]